MKKLKNLLIFALTLTVLLLAACGGDPTPTPKPEKPAEPLVRGDSAVIFGANDAFTVVYGKDSEVADSDLAGRIVSVVEGLGLKKPSAVADADKPEAKCELLIGDTSRALSAEAKAAIAENSAADPEGQHWSWIYKNGQLALYANSAEAYDLALAELTEKYYKAGEITVKTNHNAVMNVPSPEPEPPAPVIPPHDAYMSYEIPDNFYEGYTDPFGIAETDYKHMRATRKNAYTINIDYFITEKTYYRVSLVRKNWGMWMLGDILFFDNGYAKAICSGSTDYEFVISCGGETENTFRSGNHADYGNSSALDMSNTSTYNDMLVDMTFYDAKTGAKLNLDRNGAVCDANGLRLVMHHNIYEQSYAQENVLMNVEKSYLFNGFDVLLDTKLYMTQKVNIGSSYSAMLPIEKTYGNCVMLYNTDGTTTYAKTSAMGGGADTILWNFNATKVELWGENNPEYHMSVEIFNPEDQFFGCSADKSYVGIRDMKGGGSNKIYFCFGSANVSLEHGEELHFSTKWSFAKIDGFENPTREPDYFVGVAN